MYSVSGSIRSASLLQAGMHARRMRAQEAQAVDTLYLQLVFLTLC
jgi:hypothetical protein